MPSYGCIAAGKLVSLGDPWQEGDSPDYLEAWEVADARNRTR